MWIFVLECVEFDFCYLDFENCCDWLVLDMVELMFCGMEEIEFVF